MAEAVSAGQAAVTKITGAAEETTAEPGGKKETI